MDHQARLRREPCGALLPQVPVNRWQACSISGDTPLPLGEVYAQQPEEGRDPLHALPVPFGGKRPLLAGPLCGVVATPLANEIEGRVLAVFAGNGRRQPA